MFYRSLTGEKMFAGVREDGTGADRRHTSAALSGALLRLTDRVSPRRNTTSRRNGRRFLMHPAETPTAGATSHQPRVVVVQHWFDEVASKVPGR